MAWIQHVAISGLAGQNKETEITFKRGVNAIWGLNGSGKTSLLRILDGALRGRASELDGVRVKKAIVSFHSEQHERTIKRTLSERRTSRTTKSTAARRQQLPLEGIDREVELELFSDLSEAEHREMASRGAKLRQWITVPETLSMNFAHRYLPTSRLVPMHRARAWSASGRLEGAQFPKEDYDKLFAATIQDIWQQYSRGELIKVREIQEYGIAAILNSVINRSRKPSKFPVSRVDASNAYDAVTKFLKSQHMRFEATPAEFESSYELDDVLRGVVSEIVEVEQKIAEAQEPSRKVEQLVDDLFMGGKRLDLSSRKLTVLSQDAEIPLELLSSGEKQLILIFLETVAARSNCIIIDEPELSMHVDWQRKIVAAMQTINPHAQIILATHSPEVMASLSEDEIFEL
jgi:predicted ATP-dependent endonuclease of OLD family